MGARADHHVALRVSDMERAIRFWQEALDARVVAPPSLREGAFIESVFGKGTRVTVAHVAFAASQRAAPFSVSAKSWSGATGFTARPRIARLGRPVPMGSQESPPSTLLYTPSNPLLAM